MKILAIETSCDETAIALLECSGELPKPTFKVLGNALLSQIHIHKEYGGVYPMLAKREHLKNLPVLLEQVVSEALRNSQKNSPSVGDPVGVKSDAISQGERLGIDYIAVTAGPGLEPALWTGIEFAKELGAKWGIPVIPTNHMEGHLFSFLFESTEPITFPALGLLVSGGHTELVEVKGFDDYRIIGRTRDDAVGEAFDKVARLLGLPYPGGPKISALAKIWRERNGDFRASRTATAGVERAFSAENDSALRKSPFLFPRPMLNTSDYDFSYSGLKTAVLYAVKKLPDLDDETKQALAAAFEDAAIEPLIEKTRRACERLGSQSLIVGGGVSANDFLREQLASLAHEHGLDLRLPLPSLTTDNAIMIGIAAYVRLATNRAAFDGEITARGNLDL